MGKSEKQLSVPFCYADVDKQFNVPFCSVDISDKYEWIKADLKRRGVNYSYWDSGNDNRFYKIPRDQITKLEYWEKEDVYFLPIGKNENGYYGSHLMVATWFEKYVTIEKRSKWIDVIW